ncbi:ribose-phosphate diphosphokinase [Entamoeba marina]
MTDYSSEHFIIHTKKSEYLAKGLSAQLGYPIINVIHNTFMDDQELLEVIRIGGEVAEMGTRKRIFVIPYLMYSTMERAVNPGEVVTCKSTVRMLCGIPSSGLGNLFMLMDLHTAGIVHYFEGNVQAMELYAEHVLEQCIAEHIDFSEPTIFGSADLGRPLWVETFANHFSVGIAFIRKSRNFEDTHVVGEPLGDVRGKHVIIYDDLTRSAGSLIKAADAYLDHGAVKVTAVVTHLSLINETVVQRLIDSRISMVIATNSNVRSQMEVVQNSPKFVICDISPVFARQILAYLE